MRHSFAGITVGVLAGAACAQPYAMDSYTIDGGGGALVGSSYTLSGTIGQADAGVLEGATYQLTGGFWGSTGPSGCGLADVAPPQGVLDLSDINVFISGFLSQDPVSDVSPPFGVFDLSDISAFINGFIGGCP